MQKLYDRIYWKNNSVPDLNGANLNAMSKAIDDIDNRVCGIIPSDEADELYRQTRKNAEDAEYWAYESAKQVGKGNPNLLINGWFNVNSRGQSSYDGDVYTVDRWKTNYGTPITVNDGYINRDGYWGLTQRGNWKPGTYTISAWVRTNNAEGFYLSLSTGATYTIPLRKDNTWQIIKHTFSVSSSLEWLSLGVNPRPASYDIKAVKLELGNISTLAYDTAPNPAEELLRCQTSTADPSDTYANKGVLTEDAWVSTKTYAVSDYFIDNNILYKTKVQCSNVKPPNDTYYEATSVGKEFCNLVKRKTFEVTLSANGNAPLYPSVFPTYNQIMVGISARKKDEPSKLVVCTPYQYSSNIPGKFAGIHCVSEGVGTSVSNWTIEGTVYYIETKIS